MIYAHVLNRGQGDDTQSRGVVAESLRSNDGRSGSFVRVRRQRIEAQRHAERARRLPVRWESGGRPEAGGVTAEPVRSSACLGRVVIPRTPTIYAKGPEKRNGGRNGKDGANHPTNAKAVMMRQCGMGKDPRRHQTQKHQTRKNGLRASHVVRSQSAQSPLQGQQH